MHDERGTSETPVERARSLTRRVVAALREGGPQSVGQLAERWGVERKRLRTAVGIDNRLVCRVARNTYDLVERRLTGACFRHALGPTEVAHGVILADPDLPAIVEWDGFRHWRTVPVVVDRAGHPVPVRATIEQGPTGADGDTEVVGPWRVYRLWEGLEELFLGEGARPGDDLLIRVDNPVSGRFTVGIEPGGQSAVAEADRQVLETMVAVASRSRGQLFHWDVPRRLFGAWDWREAPAPHLPYFCIGTDQRIFCSSRWSYVLADKVGDTLSAWERPCSWGTAEPWYDPDQPPSQWVTEFTAASMPQLAGRISSMTRGSLAELDTPQMRQAINLRRELLTGLLADRRRQSLPLRRGRTGGGRALGR